MFAKLFPKVSLDALNKMINKSVTLFAYNDTEIKQFGTCSIRLSFQGRPQVCRFFVVEHETAIVGITDSEKLGLICVNFDWLGMGIISRLSMRSRAKKKRSHLDKQLRKSTLIYLRILGLWTAKYPSN